jgi:hypothetical protein
MNEVVQYRQLLNPINGEKSYFNFEEDFVEENVRCIPMIVRFKMDAAGIKLKLSEWSKFTVNERVELALKPCDTEETQQHYNKYLTALIYKYTKAVATPLAPIINPEWAQLQSIPQQLQEKAAEEAVDLSIEKWKALTNLQRFALLKLCRPGHENKNFPKAVKEFGIS